MRPSREERLAVAVQIGAPGVRELAAKWGIPLTAEQEATMDRHARAGRVAAAWWYARLTDADPEHWAAAARKYVETGVAPDPPIAGLFL